MFINKMFYFPVQKHYPISSNDFEKLHTKKESRELDVMSQISSSL